MRVLGAAALARSGTAVDDRARGGARGGDLLAADVSRGGRAGDLARADGRGARAGGRRRSHPLTAQSVVHSQRATSRRTSSSISLDDAAAPEQDLARRTGSDGLPLARQAALRDRRSAAPPVTRARPPLMTRNVAPAASCPALL